MSSKPNFLVVVWVPRFDNRDAIAGYRGHVIAVAETLRFANFLAAREYEDEGLSMSEISVDVRVNDARWSRPAAPATAFELDADIPF